jgi:hypothetical protein
MQKDRYASLCSTNYDHGPMTMDIREDFHEEDGCRCVRTIW